MHVHKPNIKLYRRYIQAFGIKGPLIQLKTYFSHYWKRATTISIKIPNYQEPVYLRTGTSDSEIFTQIFVENDYEFTFNNFEPKIIIDGGANVGFASVFFANAYPQAKIFAVEPEKSNFQMLAQNTRAYKQVVAINAAIWHTNCDLYIDNKINKKSAIQVNQRQQDTNEKVNGLTIEELMKTYSKSDNIDILKLDIEGSEKELFESNCESWLSKVDTIIMEVHDAFKEGCLDAVLEATKKYNFQVIKKVGGTILLKKNPKKRLKKDSEKI